MDGHIVFNHKQTEDLLKHGRTSGRGVAHAQGTINNLPAGLKPIDPNSSLAIAMSKFTGAISSIKSPIDNLSLNIQKLNSQFAIPQGLKPATNSPVFNWNGGDIIVNEPAGNATDLSKAIVNKLPNALLQEMSKRW